MFFVRPQFNKENQADRVRHVALSALLCFLLVFVHGAGLAHTHEGDLQKQFDCDICLKVNSNEDETVNPCPSPLSGTPAVRAPAPPCSEPLSPLSWPFDWIVRIADSGIERVASMSIKEAVLSMVKSPSNTNSPLTNRASTPAGIVQSPVPGTIAIWISPPGGESVALEPIPLVGSSASTKEPLASSGRVAPPDGLVISLNPCA